MITQVHRKLGSWSLRLKADAPPGLVGSLDLLGHVAVIPGRVNPVERGEECLTLARYVGVLRAVEMGRQHTLSGSGLAWWLGDEDGGGAVIEAPGVALAGATFAAAVAAVLPASGRTGAAGTIYTGVPGTVTTTRVWETRRTALDWLCDTMGGEWRIRTDGLVDAGPASALFRTTPQAVIVRRGADGYDLALKGLAGDMQSTVDAAGYTTRVVVVAEGMATGAADAVTVPFKDLHGSDVALTRLLDERDETEGGNAAARAAAALTLWGTTRRQVRLSANEFDVAGDVAPGDIAWVYDPAAGIYDAANEVPFRGALLHPAAVRVLAVTWPVTTGYTVAYRGPDGAWLDLSGWVEPESASGGEVEVADTLATPLTSGIGSIGTTVPGGGGGAGDTAVPGVPTFGTFTTASYQPDDGLARASVKATWAQPLNTDSSTIVDGDRYEIRYRPTGTSEWQIHYVPWDQTNATITNLPPSTGFDWQIRAVDYASPVNYGAWSGTTTFATADDTTAPSTPAPPTVAASLIAVQVTHTLGVAAGGTYNLPLDMDHLEVHLGASAGFTPDSTTLAGKLAATGGMVSGGIRAVGTFPTASTSAVHVKVVAVDRTGNRSPASSAASATATLIDTAHISDLTASKVTAGTLSATYTLSGTIKTGASGARVEMDTTGIRLYNSAGSLTADLNTATGNASIAGTFRTGLTGQRIEIDATGNGTIYFYPSTGPDYAFINAPAQNSCGVNSGNGGGTKRSRVYVTPTVGELKYMNLDQSQAGGRVWVDDSGAYLSALSGETISAAVTSGASLTLGTNALMVSSGGATLNAYGTTAYCEGPSGGGAFLAVQSGGTYVWARTSDMDIQGNDKLWLLGDTVEIGTGGGGQVVKSLTIYNNTSTFAANVGIATTPIGTLWRLTSSARYKVAINEIDLGVNDLLQLVPVTYYDRGQADAQGSTEGLSQQLGLIAEQVAGIPVLGPLLVEVDDDGRPESVNYSRLSVACLGALREIAVRLAALERTPAPPRRGTIPRRIRDLSTTPLRRVEPQAAATPPTTTEEEPAP